MSTNNSQYDEKGYFTQEYDTCNLTGVGSGTHSIDVNESNFLSDERSTVIFNATNVTNQKEMHDFIELQFCTIFHTYGKNLDAFVDLCIGGFNSFEDGELIRVIYTPPKEWFDDFNFLLEMKLILQNISTIELIDTTLLTE